MIFGTITLCHYAYFRYVMCHISFILMLNITRLSVIMVSVFTLSVVAPLILLNLRKNISAVKRFFYGFCYFQDKRDIFEILFLNWICN